MNDTTKDDIVFLMTMRLDEMMYSLEPYREHLWGSIDELIRGERKG